MTATKLSTFDVILRSKATKNLPSGFRGRSFAEFTLERSEGLRITELSLTMTRPVSLEGSVG